MNKDAIKDIIDRHASTDGIIETSIPGVKLFRVSSPMNCAPAVYDPSIVAILSGSKEAILEGQRHVYDSSEYLCCSMSLPVEAGTPDASLEDPLLGVSISLDSSVMAALAIEFENAAGAIRAPKAGPLPQGLALSSWDEGFTDALFRLLTLLDHPADLAVLGQGRLREVYYAALKGEAGEAVRRAFGVGNEIARSIEFLTKRLDETITIDDLANQVGMSRAVFHRKFKEATTMSPIQFVKSLRLNHAAMNIAAGMSINQASQTVGYVSPSQFSREFKRLYGQSPRQWSSSVQIPLGLT